MALGTIVIILCKQFIMEKDKSELFIWQILAEYYCIYTDGLLPSLSSPGNVTVYSKIWVGQSLSH